LATICTTVARLEAPKLSRASGVSLIGGQRFAELQVKRREAPLQLWQGGRQQVRRNGRNRSQFQHTRQHALLMLGVVDEIAHRGEDSPCAQRDLFALLGKLDTCLPSLDEADLKLVTPRKDIESVELDSRIPGSQNASVACHAWPQLAEGDLQMREWHKPTIEETESGMEVTSHPPAELDRA
jgi:coenzyme PQQ precursor peptide PqqA